MKGSLFFTISFGQRHLKELLLGGVTLRICLIADKTGGFVKGKKGRFFAAVSRALVLRMARRTKPVVTIFFKVDEAFVRIMAERTKRTRFFHAVRHGKPYQIIIPAPHLGEAEKIFKAGDAQMQVIYFIKKGEIACLQIAQSLFCFLWPVAVEEMSEFGKSGIGYHDST